MTALDRVTVLKALPAAQEADAKLLQAMPPEGMVAQDFHMAAGAAFSGADALHMAYQTAASTLAYAQRARPKRRIILHPRSLPGRPRFGRIFRLVAGAGIAPAYQRLYARRQPADMAQKRYAIISMPRAMCRARRKLCLCIPIPCATGSRRLSRSQAYRCTKPMSKPCFIWACCCMKIDAQPEKQAHGVAPPCCAACAVCGLPLF